ncbi:MAG: type IV pilin protein [Pseudomonadota bacterium]
MAKKQFGVTLVELLIVVSIIAIIASIAYPTYRDQMIKTRKTDGNAMLYTIMQEQRKYFSNQNTYTTNLIGELGYADSGDGTSVESDEGYYLISASVCTENGDTLTINRCVQLTATPTFPTTDTEDTLTYNSKNQ